MNLQAEHLNKNLREHPTLHTVLSKRGKAIYFPHEGILSQAAEASQAKFDATIGIALEEDGSPMRFTAMAGKISLPPQEVFPYAPAYGLPKLRSAWLQFLKRMNSSLQVKKISMPVVTSALTHALSVAAFLFLDKNEKIITLSPYWGNYKLLFENWFEGHLDTFPLFTGDVLNLKGLQKKIHSPGQKKVILLNFPNNPTGYTPIKEEAKQLVLLLKNTAQKGKKIVVLCDDAYAGLVYEKNILEHSLFVDFCNLHENLLAVKIDGPTKELFAWGLRVGFITFGCKGATPEMYRALEEKVAGIVRSNISNVSHLAQSLILKELNDTSFWQEKKEKYDLLRRRFEIVKKTLLENPQYRREFNHLPCNSGYFICLETRKDAERIRQCLLHKYNTGVVVVDNLLRITFSSLPCKDIPIVLDNIYKACLDSGE